MTEKSGREIQEKRRAGSSPPFDDVDDHWNEVAHASHGAPLDK